VEAQTASIAAPLNAPAYSVCATPASLPPRAKKSVKVEATLDLPKSLGVRARATYPEADLQRSFFKEEVPEVEAQPRASLCF